MQGLDSLRYQNSKVLPGLGVRPKEHFKKPKICLCIEKKLGKSGLFYITVKWVIGLNRGFLYIIGL